MFGSEPFASVPTPLLFFSGSVFSAVWNDRFKPHVHVPEASGRPPQTPVTNQSGGAEEVEVWVCEISCIMQTEHEDMKNKCTELRPKHMCGANLLR